MSYFLAVIFFCQGTSCYFWKSDTLFYTQEECIKSLQSATKSLEDNNITNKGVCLPISTKNNI